MTESSKVFTVRLDLETFGSIDHINKTLAIPNSEIIKRLVGIAVQYNIFTDKNWTDSIVKDKILLYQKQKDIDLNNNVFLHNLSENSREKDRKERKDTFILGRYLDSMSREERKQWMDNQIREIRINREEEYSTLPEKINDGFMVSINGVRVRVKEILKDGFPKMLEGYEANQTRLVRCLTGFHTKGTFCTRCEDANTCPMLRLERLGSIGLEDSRR